MGAGEEGVLLGLKIMLLTKISLKQAHRVYLTKLFLQEGGGGRAIGAGQRTRARLML